jgi:hypothetical protein
MGRVGIEGGFYVISGKNEETATWRRKKFGAGTRRRSVATRNSV